MRTPRGGTAPTRLKRLGLAAALPVLIVAAGGAAYDPWMDKLLAAAHSDRREVVVAATLTGHHAGDNPHLWYALGTMPAVARALSADLVADDPAHRAGYDARLDRFLRSLAPVDAKIAALRAKYAGLPVTATEPVFGYMASALGLVMRNERFQLAVMNNTEPSAADVAATESGCSSTTARPPTPPPSACCTSPTTPRFRSSASPKPSRAAPGATRTGSWASSTHSTGPCPPHLHEHLRMSIPG